MATSRRSATSEDPESYDSGGGKDYSAFNVWELGTDVDNVTATNSPVLEVYAGLGLHSDSDYVDGATNNSSYFRIVRAAPDEGHTGIPDTTGMAGFDGIIVLFETYSQFQDLVIITTDSIGIQASAGYNVVIGCLVTAGSTTCFYAPSGNTGGIVFVNCLAYGGGGYGFYLRDDATVLNCTAVNNTNDGIWCRTGTHILKNVNADNNGVDIDDDTTATMVDVMTSDTTGTTGNTSKNPTYVAGTNNFHLAVGSDGVGEGTDLSADTWDFDDSIDNGTAMGSGEAGYTRSAWDIGFDEYQAVGGGTTLRTLSLLGCGV